MSFLVNSGSTWKGATPGERNRLAHLLCSEALVEIGTPTEIIPLADRVHTLKDAIRILSRSEWIQYSSPKMDTISGAEQKQTMA